MTRLVMLFFFIIVSRMANAQAVDIYGLQSNHGANFEEKDILKLQKTVTSSATEKGKNPSISSAARRSGIIDNRVVEGKTTPKIGKNSSNAKSINQARKPSTDGRPVQINIPVVLVPVIAKPNRMTIPNRRISLPIGKA